VRAWLWAAKQSRTLLLKTIPIGGGVWAAGFLTQHLWASLARYTFYAVEWMLGLIYPVVVSRPWQLVVGTPAFKVEISRQCSGLEGIGLILAFFGVYLWLFRREGTRTSSGRSGARNLSFRTALSDVHPGPANRIRFRLSQNLAGHWGRVALSQRQELQQVRNRVAFGPSEVHMRDFAGAIADV
jgi:hypothetical protein